jgi:hypothetical protein
MFKLSPEAEARAAEYRNWHTERVAMIAQMTDANLAVTARYCMAQMQPVQFAPGEPVYDATMWHVYLPEMLRRLERADG